ncbi:helix-turn-helix domain-containing protein [Gillisia sp. JM1]|uniref:AlbA family DNA-binding domain-containing protein n=1 Tax=Gillisia sp. JM1 TaxID=1283286 RepID=UPI0003F4DC1F|nr:ATP-binding protein [Gillisia sp. JM1]
MNKKQLISLVKELIKQPKESEWVEFKLNYHSAEEIGERISALANSACLLNLPYG